jgi:orotate phosphoribosyltransferase
LLKKKSLKFGNFVLASGRTSTYYIDGRLTSFDPAGAALIAEAVLKEIEGMAVDAVGGMDMGATPIVGAVACRSHYIGRPMPTFVVRKEVKSHGTQKKIEGNLPAAGGKVVIIDDVVTSGDSIIKAIDATQEAGCAILLAISVLDRGAGAAETLAARGIAYRPLVTLADLGIS